MDNLTHSLVGAAIAESGPRDRVVLATPTLIIAANVPDVDVITYLFASEFAALAWRRGITHGIPALVLWPFVVAGAMIAWDRWVRRRRRPDAAPARFAPLLLLAAIGALTHPALDWLNTYGMRWWLPFDPRWSYGDAVFIIDPFLWLALGGAVFLARSRGVAARIGWGALALLTSLLVLMAGAAFVPDATRIVWVVSLVALIAARVLRPVHDHPTRRRRIARIATAGAAAYILAMVAVSAVAERAARGAAEAMGLAAVDVMTAPLPGTVIGREVVVRTADAYHHGSWRWRQEPRLRLATPATPVRSGPEEAIERALEDQDVRHFLVWSRYPYLRAQELDDGWSVRVGDARYSDRGLGGFEVRIRR